ncbi:MCE family protein [Nocardioides abyssi]|uniref:MCE family protein n=1 Tax=Nocardioides abyssi TaxID=3058370 RepID=A0ABT8EXZ2_9ACTN|nr:MCE family protein [Nocardioides abyssi]MDN4163045.1 MCE family protein [Nocardioides abyssi]
MTWPARTRRSTSAVLLVAVLGGLLGTAGCDPLGPSTIRLTAELDDAAGLFVGNDVGVLGVPVGEITAIEPRGPVVEVELEVDGDTDLPASAGAVVVARSVATDRYLELTPAFADGPRMEDGDRIPLERTRTPVEFDEVLASLEGFSTGLAGEDGEARALRRLLSSSAEALGGRGADANATIRELSAAAGGLSDHREELVGAVDGLDRLTALVAANDDVVDQLLTSVADATDLLADERHAFGRSLTSLSGALDTLAAFVRDNRGALRGSLRGLTRVTRNLLVHQADLAEAIEVSPLTFANIGDAISDDERLKVRMPLRHLSPAHEVTDVLCDDVLPVGVCDELGTSPDLLDLLRALLGRRP